MNYQPARAHGRRCGDIGKYNVDYARAGKNIQSGIQQHPVTADMIVTARNGGLSLI